MHLSIKCSTSPNTNKTIFENAAINLKKMHVLSLGNALFFADTRWIVEKNTAHVAQVLLHCAFKNQYALIH